MNSLREKGKAIDPKGKREMGEIRFEMHFHLASAPRARTHAHTHTHAHTRLLTCDVLGEKVRDGPFLSCQREREMHFGFLVQLNTVARRREGNS